MKVIKEDLRRYPFLIIGLILLAIGLAILKNVGYGLNPWGVFHDGISQKLNMSMGTLIRNLGYILVFLSIFIKIYPGPGTILNILLVGYTVDFVIDNTGFGVVDTTILSILWFILGFFLMTFGRAFYISAKMGSGPRDGLFVGLSKVFKIKVKYSKMIIEALVVLIGFLTGGVLGFGTIILVFCSGYFVQLYFKILKFDPSKTKTRSFKDYINKNY